MWIEGSSSVHPIHSTTTGLEGWIDLRLTDAGRPDLRTALSARIEFPVSRLRSSNPLEDRELRRRIDARNHPTIEGALTTIVKADEPGRFAVTGDVTFRGVTRPHADLMDVELLDDGSLHLGGRSYFDIREFGMEPPRILMLRVDPVVEVIIDVIAAPEEV